MTILEAMHSLVNSGWSQVAALAWIYNTAGYYIEVKKQSVRCIHPYLNNPHMTEADQHALKTLFPSEVVEYTEYPVPTLETMRTRRDKHIQVHFDEFSDVENVAIGETFEVVTIETSRKNKTASMILWTTYPPTIGEKNETTK